MHSIVVTGLGWAAFSMTLSMIFGSLNFHYALTAKSRVLRIQHGALCVLFGGLFLLAGRTALVLWGML